MKWFELQNLLKSCANPSYLSSAQAKAFFKALELLMCFGRCNLYGDSGSGKTFVAWILQKHYGAYHCIDYSRIASIPPTNQLIILDNFPAEQIQFRRACARLPNRQLLVCTRKRIPDHIQAVPLVLGNSDMEQILLGINRELGVTISPGHSSTNCLWTHLFN